MKRAIVTGASGNLGQAVVRQLLADGYKVTGTLVPNDPPLQGFDEDRFSTVTADLMDEDATTSFVREITSGGLPLDVAVLTVGGFAMGDISATGSGDIRKQLRLNFETAYNVARLVFARMVEQGKGRIFFIGSRPGLDMKQSKGMVAYGLAKSLLFRLAELMNEEAKGKNVVCSVIVPSTIDTPQNRNSMPDADPEKWVKPEAIAKIISFYCSDAADVLREPVIKVYNNS
jgi:NAD(P)-dependent dehydrogenase (short-subunit alcohol dehydrogenase family)